MVGDNLKVESDEQGAEPTDRNDDQARADAAADAAADARQAARADGGDFRPRRGTLGMVRDAISGEPLPGVSVRFTVIDPGAEAEDADQFDFAVATVSDPPGQYTYEAGFPQGVARVTVQAGGYETLLTYQNHWYDDECGGAKCAVHDFELWPEGAVHELLPDLLPNPSYFRPSQVMLTNQCDGRDDISICLRMTIGVANLGPGDLFMTAPLDDLSAVTQHVFDSSGEVSDVELEGAFEHHEALDRIDFPSWAELSLRRVDDACEDLSEVDRCAPERTADKHSVCVRNSVQVDADFSPARLYDCVVNADDLVEQGISAGFMDIDNSEFRGQLFDVTGLSNGEYWLEIAVNPSGVVRESDYSNNVVRARYRLQLPECGDGVIDFPESCEGDNLNGATCASIDEHFSGGDLACNDTCGFDRSGCTRAVCDPIDLGSTLGRVAEGDNLESRDTVDPVRCRTPNGTGRDKAYSWTAPETGRYNISDISGSLFVSVRDGTCDGPELACVTERAERGVDVDVEQGQTVVIILDVYPDREGVYSLYISEPR
jgi:hypothetical protein